MFSIVSISECLPRKKFIMQKLDLVYVVCALTFHALLLTHFALRKWRFATAMRWGWIVYALSVPAAAISAVLLWNGRPWAFWTAGFLYLIWGVFGYIVEYRMKIEWRQPIFWPVLGPYLLLYLATCMFYWFPLSLIQKWLWYVVAVLFITSTLLNVTSHGKPKPAAPAPRSSTG
jgi:hypothetical protein